MIPFFVVLVLGLGAIGAVVVGTRNKLATLSARIDNAWSQIDVQLQRRADLLPPLVAALGNAGVQVPAESLSLDAGGAPGSFAAQVGAQSDMDDAVARLLTMAQTPSVEDNTAVVRAVDEVMSADKQLMYMRQSFNDTVAKYNEALSVFPGSLLGPTFGFEPRPTLQIDPAAKFSSF